MISTFRCYSSGKLEKRGRAIGQLVEQEQPKRGKYRAPIVIAGDFNADRFSPEFASEPLFKVLAAAKFADSFEEAAKAKRITHPGRTRNSGSTIDYVVSRGLSPEGPPLVVPALRLSDHNAVFVRFAVQ